MIAFLAHTLGEDQGKQTSAELGSGRDGSSMWESGVIDG